jgi:hypothetical protein
MLSGFDSTNFSTPCILSLELKPPFTFYSIFIAHCLSSLDFVHSRAFAQEDGVAKGAAIM